MACRWCAGLTKSGALYCSATHKSRANEKRGQIAAGKCRFPSLATHLSQAAASAAAKPGERALHCLNGCHGWHLTAGCPTPEKAVYSSSFEARQAQRGAEKSGMRPYQCPCKLWHWGHPWKTRRRIATVMAIGNHKAWEARRRRPA